MRNVRELVDSITAGRRHTCSVRKVPSQAATARWWVDLSMAAEGADLPFRYCNLEVKADSPYCEAHSAIAFREPPPRKEKEPTL